MPRIPESEIERIKRETDLAALVRSRGIELKPHGSKDLAGKCPFHQEDTASFIVTPDKGLFHCLGCGAGGSVIDFVMKMNGLSFRHAVEVLQSNPAALSAARETRKATVPILSSPLVLDADDRELMKQTLDYYQETLLRSGNALSYLQGRGLRHPEMIKRFRIGYCNRTLGYRLPEKNRKNGDEIRSHLQKLGLYRESGHEHFNGCIVFPVWNDQEEITEIYGRRIIKPVRQSPKHLYLPGPHGGVWNAEGVRNAREWILCEAIIDALTFWVHGFENVTASYGVRGFTPDLFALLRLARPERVLIAYDNDEAGNAAANELAHRLEAESLKAWRIELPPNADVNDVARSADPACGGTGDPQAMLASLLAVAVRLLPEDAPSHPAVPVVALKQQVATVAIPPPVAGGKLIFSVDGNQAEMNRGDPAKNVSRAWRMRGLIGNTSFDHLKVNVRLLAASKFHVDTFDLYNARQRTAFMAAANQITGVDTRALEEDLAILIAQIEEYQERKIFEKLKGVEKQPVMTPEEEQKALAMLREPDIFQRILADFIIAGTVGEETNKLIGYLVAVSRKLDDPLSALVISRSAAGKSALLNAILAFVPDEDKEVLTAMTAQALFYLPDNGLAHKVLAVVEDEGGEQASYPMKILQSEKVLVLAVTVKDPEGGLPQTKLKKVEGPVAQLMTSTQAELDYEVANRYLILTVDEEREQTRRIHEAQREAETLTGLLKKLEREEILKNHHNAQRLLRPLRVVNPYAKLLTFPDDRLRLRRDHQKYLGLIRTVAFLRQFQKPVKHCEHKGKALQYVEVDEEDIRLAHPLAAHVLGRCLDELSPPTRAFLTELHRLALRLEKERAIKRGSLRLTRREIREQTRWGEAQVRRYLDRLVELEYVIAHRMPGTGARFEYELLYDGQGADGRPFIPGLADIEAILRSKTSPPPISTPDDSSSKKPDSSPVPGLSSGKRHGIVMGSSPVRHARAHSLSSSLAAC